MELLFKTGTLRRACTEERESDRLWGAACAQIIRRRLAQLAAASTLAVIRTLRPADLRSLSRPRDGLFAVAAGPPVHIILEPAHDPVPTSTDGCIDEARVTIVRIISVEDLP